MRDMIKRGKDSISTNPGSRAYSNSERGRYFSHNISYPLYFHVAMKLSNKVLCLSLLKNFSSKFAHTDRNFNKVLYFYPGLHRQISNFIVNKITIYCNSNILGGQAGIPKTKVIHFIYKFC